MVNLPTISEETGVNKSEDNNSLLDILSSLLREETPAASPNTFLISTENLIRTEE